VLDLNIEQDKIEEPYKPMLRIATPIFEGKEKKGILILNYLAQEIINELDVDVVLGQGDYGKPELLNTDGYWLSSNIPEREWGFMFEDKQDLTLTKINPTLWNLIKSNSEGQVLLSDGLYTFSTIVPIDNFNLEWKLYRFIPNSILYEESNKVKDRLIYFNIVIILLLFLAVTLNIVFFSKVIKGSIAQKKYQYLFNNSQEAIMTISPPDWKFTDGNPATIKLFGLKDGEQLKIITPGDLSPQYQPNGELSSDKAREMIQKALDNGFHTFDWVHKKINGEEFSAVVTLNKVQVNDEVFLQGMVRDVTDEKKQEELLRKSVNETAKALAESERLNKSMTGRELAMIELKKKNRELEEKLKNIKLRL
jgi:PAS domain S-box-containing protein